jgi:integrase
MIRRARPETLREYLIEYATTRAIDPETVRQYEIAIRLFEQWAGETVRLDQLEELTISAWLRDYGHGVSQTTVRNKRTMIVALWRNAADDGYIDPPRRRIRTAKIIVAAPVAWTMEEVVRLRAACRALKRPHKSGLPRSVWWELAVCVAWDSGLRWGDLVRLRVDQVPPHGICVVTQHKTGRLSIFRLAPDTMRLLAHSLAICPRDLVCPWPASGETFREQVKRLVAKAGIRKGTWKWLRRASGTDVEVQQRGAAAGHLGHRPGSRIAELYYVDPVIVAEATGFVSPRPLADAPPALPAATDPGTPPTPPA